MKVSTKTKTQTKKRPNNLHPKAESLDIMQQVVKKMKQQPTEICDIENEFKIPKIVKSHLCPQALKEIVFVPRILSLLKYGMRRYVNAKQTQIKHLDRSIQNALVAKGLPKLLKLHLQQEERLDHELHEMLENLQKSHATLERELFQTIGMLENRTKQLRETDTHLYTGLLRRLPCDLRKLVFSFLHIGFVYEPLIVQFRHNTYWCKFNFENQKFLLFADAKMKEQVLETNKHDLNVLFDTCRFRHKFYWWSSGYGVRHENFRSQRKPNNDFGVALEMLKNQTERVPTHGWKRTNKTFLNPTTVKEKKDFFFSEILQL